MHFHLDTAIEILERTPSVLEALLANISEDWHLPNEGKDTWSAYDIVGHLIHGEKTDWITRMDIILSEGPDKKFDPFDRFAQFRESNGKPLGDLLREFKALRKKNIALLKARNLSAIDLLKTGVHPVFGTVTLRHLLATWVVHDLSHIAQIARVMAKQYKTEVGPWLAYIPLLSR